MRIRNRAAQPQAFGFRRTRRASDSKRRLRGVLINSAMNAPKGVEHYQVLQEYLRIESRIGPNLVDIYV